MSNENRYPLCVMKDGDRDSDDFRIVNNIAEEDAAEKDGYRAVGAAARKKASTPTTPAKPAQQPMPGTPPADPDKAKAGEGA